MTSSNSQPVSAISAGRQQQQQRLEVSTAYIKAQLALGAAATATQAQTLQQFHAARPTTAQIRGRSDLNHEQIDLLLAGPCTRAASKSVDRYLAIAEGLDAFAARLEAIG